MLAQIQCGSWLACEEADAVFQLNRIKPFAGKPAPTVFFGIGFSIK
jgi:hypothetical protein